jgi:hypothetical protein
MPPPVECPKQKHGTPGFSAETFFRYIFCSEPQSFLSKILCTDDLRQNQTEYSDTRHTMSWTAWSRDCTYPCRPSLPPWPASQQHWQVRQDIWIYESHQKHLQPSAQQSNPKIPRTFSVISCSEYYYKPLTKGITEYGLVIQFLRREDSWINRLNSVWGRLRREFSTLGEFYT